MNQLVPIARTYELPVIVAATGERGQIRFLEFFAAQIRNANTRRAYARAVGNFLAWCEGRGVRTLSAVQPLHVAGYIEILSRERSAPTAKQYLAAISAIFKISSHLARVVRVRRWSRSAAVRSGSTTMQAMSD
jgi:integrase/recombinase XerC